MNAESVSGTVRFGAIAGMIGGAATAVSGLVIQAFVQPTSTVSPEMWSYPWPSDTFVSVTLVFTVFHLLVFLGILAFARSGVAGTTRSARVGAVLALTGTAVFVAAELASIPFSDQRMDQSGPGIVGATFGLATALTAVGLLLAGSATLRANRWLDWRRFVPLGAGVWTTVLLGVAATPAISAGVGVYGLCIFLLALAVYTQPVPASGDSQRRPTIRANAVT